MVNTSRKILETVLNGELYRVHYGCDGTEANEAAIKTAGSFTGRNSIVSFMGGFYGRTIVSLSCMAQKDVDAQNFRSLRSANIYFTKGLNILTACSVKILKTAQATVLTTC